MFPMRVSWFLGLLALACPGRALAQAGAPDKPPTVHLGGYIQYDFLAPLGDETSEDPTFRFRRVRIAIGGEAIDNVDYLVTAEVTTPTILRDASITLSGCAPMNWASQRLRGAR